MNVNTQTRSSFDPYNRIRIIWRDNRWLYVVAGFSLGVIAFPLIRLLSSAPLRFIDDLVPEAVGILFTVLILDVLAENRESRRLNTENMQRIIREMRSPNADEGARAADEARERGFLTTGRFAGTGWFGIKLNDANLSEANLEEAKLASIWLMSANLSGVNLQSSRSNKCILDQCESNRSKVE